MYTIGFKLQIVLTILVICFQFETLLVLISNAKYTHMTTMRQH